MIEKARRIPFRNVLWVRQHPMRLALVVALAAIVGALFLTPFSGAIASPMLQMQPSPTPAAQEVAVIAVTEFDGSGFHATATLLSSNDETEVLVGVLPPAPSLFGFGKSEEDLGMAAIYSGFCGVLGDSEEELGEPMELYRFDGDKRGFYALRQTVDMSMDDLLSGDYAVVILQSEEEETDEEPASGFGAQQVQPEQPDALACGTLVPESRLGPATSQ